MWDKCSKPTKEIENIVPVIKTTYLTKQDYKMIPFHLQFYKMVFFNAKQWVCKLSDISINNCEQFINCKKRVNLQPNI